MGGWGVGWQLVASSYSKATMYLGYAEVRPNPTSHAAKRAVVLNLVLSTIELVRSQTVAEG